jgi:hypothetical protein
MGGRIAVESSRTRPLYSQTAGMMETARHSKVFASVSRTRRLGGAWLGIVLVACLGLVAVAVAPARAAESGPPLIEGLSLTEVGGQVEVGGKIDPDGFETVYAIIVECGAAERSGTCEQLASPPGTGGLLAAGYESDEARLNVTGLLPGFYEVEMVATSLAGKVTLREQLEIPAALPVPKNEPEPYERPNAEGAEWGPRSAELSIAEYRAAERAKQEQERAAQEAARPLAPAVPAARPPCVVPSLIGHTLAGARRLLTQAHCELGHITYPGARRGRLRIAKQGHARGSRLSPNAAVAVRLARCVSCSG